jgi:hypothetical protein
MTGGYKAITVIGEGITEKYYIACPLLHSDILQAKTGVHLTKTKKIIQSRTILKTIIPILTVIFITFDPKILHTGI